MFAKDMKALITNNLVTDMKKTMKLLLTTALVLVRDRHKLVRQK